MDLLLLIDNDKSHYVYIKDFNRFMFHKTKTKNKKWFSKGCLQRFSSENILVKHKKNCLSINGKQSVKLEEGIIKFENCFKQIPVSFQIYPDFKCNLKKVKCNEGSYTEKYQDHIPCSFAYKIVCIDDRFTKPTIIYRRKNAAYGFIKAILEECKYCKKIIKGYFNKHLIMTEKEENLCQKIKNSWICKAFINNNNEEKVRDHCHVTGKFRGAAHRHCSVNFQLTKKVPEIFQNLRGHVSHLIFNELDKFDVKIKVIPNGLEKYMAFSLNKNLVFIDNMQFMNSSLDKLIRNSSGKDFKYLIDKFGSENLELLKQKGAYPYQYMNSFERFNEEKLPSRKYFYSSIKDGKIGDDGKISDGCIDVNDYYTCKKTRDKFEMKNMGDYHDHYLKKDVLLLAGVFEKFINTCLKYYGLDPCHYFSSPGLSWDALLKMTDIELQKISDIDKYLFIENRKRNFLHC